MKNIWPSGSILLLTNALTLFCTSAIWVDWLRRDEYLLCHLMLMATVMLLPVPLWLYKIELDEHFLRLCSAWGEQKIRLIDIRRVQIELQHKRCVLSVYLPNSKRPALKCDITNFERDEIKNLLDEMRKCNSKIHVLTPGKY